MGLAPPLGICAISPLNFTGASAVQTGAVIQLCRKDPLGQCPSRMVFCWNLTWRPQKNKSSVVWPSRMVVGYTERRTKSTHGQQMFAMLCSIQSQVCRGCFLLPCKCPVILALATCAPAEALVHSGCHRGGGVMPVYMPNGLVLRKKTMNE